MASHAYSVSRPSISRQLVRVIATCGLLAVVGCSSKQEPVKPDYSRPLGPGESALRKLGPGQPWPDIARAYRERSADLVEGIDRSIAWFAFPSSRQFFPFEDICTHEQALESLVRFRELVQTSSTPEQFTEAVKDEFDAYQSVGYNGEGVVLFTGYYAPIFQASSIRTSRFRFPIYARPNDLVTEPVTGKPIGRRMSDGTVTSWPTRRDIESSRMLEGTEVAWLDNALDVYIIHVNGSARLDMLDGSTMYVGYAGKTDREYTGLGYAMIEEGLIKKDDLTLSAIKAYYRKHPEQVQELIYRNENYVFFTEYDGSNWPAGSLGVKVTPKVTLATDKAIYPRGGLVLVDTKSLELSAGRVDFNQFMLDQDTGGAIKAPGRADIYMGVGPRAEVLAGGQYAEGNLFYFFLKRPLN